MLNDENEALKQDIEVKDTNMKWLNSEKIKLQNQSRQLSEEISILRQRLDDVEDSNQEQLHELERQNATLKDDNTYLQDQIQNEKERKSREAAEIERTRSNEEIAQLKHQRDSLHIKLKEMKLLKKEFDMKQQRVSQVFHFFSNFYPFIFLSLS